ncbi:16S rRNA methyltransferase [Lampropedia cohaerens]|uniref:Ribosomal RNA small subunit methyltransferase I n=1 Tax=Lampropedia cohaerens TaxID=1610491 RepID=A0A0U1PYS4_9BURK|nr:16S rRNA (cytidine(1402)-2'-O)-methyltransferase [Lampropedia cohaerens]KKW67668.1 16S rRNA methyltransferase [Lampropedia cohaerens]
MTPSFALALQAAHAAAGSQHYPQAALYMVATPIGNLADISLRALHVLQLVDAIACEDTRHTRQLLQAYGIDKPGNALLALHQHNERSAAQAVVERLRQGLRIAYVSDAGTPGISDPGALLVDEVQRCGLRVVPLPGASSVTTALSATALVQGAGGYLFAGFLPAKGKARQTAIAALQAEARPVVLLESPHRITELAASLAVLGDRPVTLARELTKQFEQLHTTAARGLSDWLREDAMRQRGEFVVIVHAPEKAVAESAIPQEALRLMQLLNNEGVSLKSAARVAAQFTGAARNALYEAALAQRHAGSERA